MNISETKIGAKKKYINPSTGRYFPLKYLFGTCLKNFFINHSHTVLLLYLCQYVVKRLKKNILGDVALSVIGLEGAKNGSKKGGVASRLGVFIENA